MIRAALLATFLAWLSVAATAAPDDLTEYWSSEYHYGIAYPSNWKVEPANKFDGSEVFSVLNSAMDVNINVLAKRLSPQNKGRYRTIADMPDAKEYFATLIRDEIGGVSIQSGITQISNEPALWFTYSMVRKSLNREVWFSVYQIQVLRKDISYSISAKVSGLSREQAVAKYKKYLPTINRTIASLTFAL